MTWFEEVLLTVLVGLSPIWAALGIGAICWAARRFGGATRTRGGTPPPLRRSPSPACRGGLGNDEQCSPLRTKK